MKNLHYALILSLFLFSCSDEDLKGDQETINKNLEQLVLLKKTISKSSNGDSITQQYEYDGNKLMAIKSSNGTRQIFNYKDNTLVSVTEYLEDGNKIKSKLSYDFKGRLVRVVEQNQSGYEIINEYAYPTDSTMVFNIGKASITYSTDRRTGNFKVAMGEEETYLLNYDNKNNPHKNMAFKKVLSLFFNTSYTHNQLSYKRTKGNDPDDLSHAVYYEYNSKQYPIKSTITYNVDSRETAITSQTLYFYE